MNWHLVHKGDKRFLALADRHYSRQKPGTSCATPPGKNICLIVPCDTGGAGAIWSINHQQFSMDGFDCWRNSYFRNESGIRSSLLIAQAIAVCVWLWPDLPADGLCSFVDPRHVRGVKVRGERVHGWVFSKAGFRLHPERTKDDGLFRWMFSREQLRAVTPEAPGWAQMRMAI